MPAPGTVVHSGTYSGHLLSVLAALATLDELSRPGVYDRINVTGLPPVPGQNVRFQIVKADGSTIDFEAVHTFSPEQVEWFKAGSALNIVRQKVAAEQSR